MERICESPARPTKSVAKLFCSLKLRETRPCAWPTRHSNQISAVARRGKIPSCDRVRFKAFLGWTPASPFDRFKQFARMIAAVPKSEMEKIEEFGSARSGAGLRKRKNGNAKKDV